MTRMENIQESYKYYKKKQPPPIFDSIIDFHNLDEQNEVFQQQLLRPRQPAVVGLQPVGNWKAFQLQSYPGFTFICNPFENGFQRYWIKKCLCHYPTKPSKTNLDIHMKLTENDNIWQIGQRSGDSSGKTALEKLRWTTLGYHHDWDTKVYSKDNYTAFPGDLSCLSAYIAATLGYPKYEAQAAIINYYHMDSTLGPHNDHSELDQESPLISVSFGQSAIFLLGGKTRDDPAVPIYIRSGDIMVMYGPGRLNYHAVPRIINTHISRDKQCSQYGSSELYNLDKTSEVSGDQSSVLCQNETGSVQSIEHYQCVEDPCKTVKKDGSMEQDIEGINHKIEEIMQETLNEDWTPFEQYLSSARINMNVRQVYKQEEDKESEFLTEKSKRQKLDKLS